LFHCIYSKEEIKSFIIDTEKSAFLIRIEKGQTISIKLQNYTATGYSWEIEHQFGEDITFKNKNILTMNKLKSSNQPTLMGGVQIEEFIYSVSDNLKYSSVTVDFILKRSWEENPIKRISVLIRFDKL